jgi:diguanylate cyclase (GGDEF)-like protein/PAS domain S-box-containing protein
MMRRRIRPDCALTHMPGNSQVFSSCVRQQTEPLLISVYYFTAHGTNYGPFPYPLIPLPAMPSKLKNKIALLIAVGNTLILVLLIAIGLVVTTSMRHLSSITSDLYQHPFTVNNAALVAKFKIEHMRDHMLEIALFRDAKKAENLSAELATLDSGVRENFRVVETSFLGDPAKVKEAQRLLDEWRDIRKQTLGLAAHGQWDTVENLVMTANKITFVRLSADVDDIVTFTRHRAEAFVTEANDEAMTEISRIVWLLASFATAIFIIGLEMSRRTWRLIHAEERAVEAVNKSEKSYRSLFDNMLEGYALCRMIYADGQAQDFTFLDVNGSFAQLTGLKEVIGKNASAAIPGIRESNLELLEIFGRVASSGKPEQFETYVKELKMWFSFSVYSTEKEDFVAIFSNITKRKKYERQWRLAASIFQASSEAMLITDSRCNIIAVNPAFTSITGYAADEVLGKNPRQLCSGHHDETFYQEMLRALASTNHWEGEIWDMKKNGEAYALRLIISAIPDDTAAGWSYAAQFSDITGKKRMEEALSKHANFDSLTGLSNRRLFRHHLEQEIKIARRSHNKLALLFIDLDRFKEVNDTLGHHAGDQLLVEAAQRIVSCVREADIVSRLGGDEFTVILSEIRDVNRIENVAHAIIQSLCQPYRLGGEAVIVSASIGITVYPTDATNSSDLLRNADQAMYLSKSEGKNCFNFFTKAMQEDTRKHQQLAQDLHGALQGNQFLLYFQPIVDLNTGEIFKAETLLRWQHPLRGMIDPAEFVPIAEAIGLIDEIGDWVFKETLEQSRRWSRLIGRAFRIGVNISQVQLMSNAGNNVWISHVHEMKLTGKNVSIEITEGTLLNDRPGIAESLLTIHAAGMEVAIDDFGTGYSSLAALQKFKIEYLKIDQSFTRNLTTGSADLALSEAIIVMAHKLGMKVIAEGIETQEQRDLLKAAGCDFGQGYFFSRPVPGEEFESFLQGRIAAETHPANEAVYDIL